MLSSTLLVALSLGPVALAYQTMDDDIVTVTSTYYAPMSECCTASSAALYSAMAPAPANTSVHYASYSASSAYVAAPVYSSSAAYAAYPVSSVSASSSPAAVAQAATGTTSAWGSTPTDGCVGPSTNGAACGGDIGGCCGGFSCDSTTNTCTPEDDPFADSDNAQDDGCNGPSTLGAACGGDDNLGCCGGLACDVVSNTCVADD